MSTKANAKSSEVFGFFILVIVLLLTILAYATIDRHVNVKTNFRTEVPMLTTIDIYDSAGSYAIAEAAEHLSIAIVNTQTILLESIAEPEPEITQTPEEQQWSYVQEFTNNYYPELKPYSGYIYAIIYHESRHNPDVVNSKSGTTGLMQISPKWHTKRAADLGVTNLKDPYGNILVGCDILNDLTKSYNFEYALNFFAGGYPYANRYSGKTSPYISELRQIISEHPILNGGD